MRISEVYDLLHHQNPVRPGTPTKLPDDLGAFEHIASEDRIVKVSRTKSQRSKDRTLTLPNNKRVELHFLGAGHASMAFQGSDGWVYVLTRTDVADPAKEVLANLIAAMGKARDAYLKHIPWIEEVGHSNRVPGSRVPKEFTWLVHRMPYYRRLTSEHGLREANIAQRIYNKVIKHHDDLVKKPSQYMKEIDSYMQAVDLAGRTGALDRSVADAICLIATWLILWTKYIPPEYDVGLAGFAFEFPKRNLAQDEKGNLVLLDVFFWNIEAR